MGSEAGIYVWGTGCGASELLERGFSLDQVTAFVDSFPGGESFLGKPVLLPEQLDVSACDLVIVTARHTQQIAQSCERLGIPLEKCLFLKNYASVADRNAGCTAKSLLDPALLEELLPRQRVISTPSQLCRPILSEMDLDNDYVRLSTLELLCRRLEAVPGAAAELGVYRGAFARCIGQLLPTRKLYLFDSFEGFSPDAAAPASFQAAHANTAVEKVLRIIPGPERVIVKPGFFPGSLEGLEETFCFVSLDVDFEQTTLDGLRYFWPRLSPGGYLMLHDWGSPSLPGVRLALDRYQEEIGTKISSVPLCDLGGTIVLCK